VLVPGRANATQKTLKILQWNHFVPAYDEWFNNVYVKAWGEQHDTKVIVDNVGMTSLNGRAEAEISAQKGHDLFMFLLPPPTYEDHVMTIVRSTKSASTDTAKPSISPSRARIIPRPRNITASQIAMSRIL
jgi:multiple sugar transport system substrate-binding protein